MTELQHDRAPDPKATQTLALIGGKILADKAVLSIRIWTGHESKHASDFSSKTLNAAVCATVDLAVASSGQVVLTHGNTLVVAFPGLPAAILAARRLQWVFQGLSEADQFAGAAAAVLVHSSADLPDDPSGDAFSHALEQAAPGQILLGETVCQILDDLPGLTIGQPGESGLRELIWRGPEDDLASLADEQTLFRNIKRQGSGNADSSKDIATSAFVVAQETSNVEFADAIAPEDQFDNGPIGQFWPPRGKTLWLILGGAAATLICGVGLVAIAMHLGTRAASAPQSPSLQLDAPPGSSPANQVGVSGTAGGLQVKSEPQAGRPQGSNAANGKPKKQPDDSQKQEPRTFGCDLGEAGIQRTLVRAENSLHAGQFGNAQRDFQSVLACDRTNAKALEGLREVKQLRDAAR
jgi:hypothetical protein